MSMTANQKDRILAAFYGALAGFVLSKGLALIPALGMDDYVAVHQDRDIMFYMWQGRFTQALVQLGLTGLGVTPTSIAWPVILLFFAMGSLGLAYGVNHVARDKGDKWTLAACAGLMAAFPYLTEYFTFREALATQATSFVLLAIVLMGLHDLRAQHASASITRQVFLVLCMALLAGAQQTAFVVLACFVVAAVAADVIDGRTLRSSLQWRNNGRSLAMLVLAAIVYVVVYALIKKIFGAPSDARSSFLPLGELGTRFSQIFDLVKTIVLFDEGVAPRPVKQLFLFLYAIALLLVGLRDLRAAAWILLASLLMFAGGIFLVSVSAVWWPVPRAMYAVGFALGLAMLLVALCLPLRWSSPFRALVIVGACCLAFQSSSVLYDQLRLNRWDSWSASAIINDLVARGIASDTKIVLVGAGWAHPAGLPTLQGDLNVSALAIPWATADLFMETTGRPWSVDSIPSSSECQGLPAWPAHASVQRVGDTTYVCMGTR